MVIKNTFSENMATENMTTENSNKLSVCILTKNVEDKIEACLESVLWADEIVILDSGSTDSTLDIANNYKVTIHQSVDWPGFGPQHRRIEELAKNDWLLSIDSDEVVSEELKTSILDVLKTAKPDNVFIVNRLTHFCGKYIYHSGWYPDPIVRLYNKQKYRYNEKLVHEAVACKGAKKSQLDGHLYHYTFDNLADYINKRNGYAKAWAEDRHQKGKKSSVLKAVSSALFSFIRHYILRLGILDGRIGFLISVIQMQYSFNKYMMLFLLGKKDK